MEFRLDVNVKWVRNEGTACALRRSQRRRGASPAEMSKSVTQIPEVAIAFHSCRVALQHLCPPPPVIITHHSDSPQVAAQRGLGRSTL